ncbi:hypothetical protein [Flavobacterium sp.]|uniref:hypothetical protein n=1 Tax=Flavobacterium sp. TaxID=239 RepID=UPI0037526268
MKFKIKYSIFLLLITTFAFANASIILKGSFSNIDEEASVVLRQYNYGEKVVGRTSVKSGKCVFNNLEKIEDGVYQIVINSWPNASSKKPAYSFDVIIDSAEDTFEFSFDPKRSNIPTIISSKINIDWYQYMQKERFKIAVLNQIEISINPNNPSQNISKMNLKEINEKEVQELKNLKSDYIKKNYNKWSTSMVQNATNLIWLFDFSKEKFWKGFQTDVPSLLNTPIYQNIVQAYIIKYYGDANEEEYKQGFEEVIKQFSKNSATNEWVVKYVITGLNQIGNNNLESYFSKRYNYKI